MKTDARRLYCRCRRILASEEGPTIVEYAVLLTLIIVVCLTIVRATGKWTKLTFTTVANSVGS